MQSQTNAAAWLEPDSGDPTPIRGTCFLGRATNSSLVLPSDKVSRRHAMVHAQGQEEYWLIDLGSANGTYLNGRRIGQPSRLADQDQIKIAHYTFTFRHPRVRPATAATITAEKTIQEIKSLNCWLLVADIESSTQFTQRLPLEEAPRVTGRWLAECKQIIDDSNGAINKFLGDGFFAYWLEGEGTAASVARALAVLKQQQDREQPRFRVVVHYGKVFVGGAASLGEESLLGNEVNFVFRMEKMASALGALRLLSEPANEHIKAILPTREEGRQSLDSFEGNFLFFSF